MKRLFIYHKNSNGSNTLLRIINVTVDFIGISKKGQINNFEFKKLALDLEPTADFHEVI